MLFGELGMFESPFPTPVIYRPPDGEPAMSFDIRQGGFPVPRIYEDTFHGQPAWVVMHWHWFWSAADTLHVLRPPAPGGTAALTPAVIEALARALVADVLAEAESSKENGEEL